MFLWQGWEVTFLKSRFSDAIWKTEKQNQKQNIKTGIQLPHSSLHFKF